MFLSAIDASGEYKNAEYLANCISQGVEAVGVENVIQVITDSAPVCRAATELIRGKYPQIYPAPCATHCLDLLLQDFGKLQWVSQAIKNCFEVIKFVTNHQKSNFYFKESSKLNLKKPCATRFATNFLMVDRIVQVKGELQGLVVSPQWSAWLTSREVTRMVRLEGVKVKNDILDDGFWMSLREVICISEPVVKVLRATDAGAPFVGSIWVAMREIGEKLELTKTGEMEGYEDVLLSCDQVEDLKKLHVKRWQMLTTDLHLAGYVLNPQFWSMGNGQEKNIEVTEGFANVVHNFFPTDAEQGVIYGQLANYRNKDGVFGRQDVIKTVTTLPGWQWWQTWGGQVPELQRLAIRILSQVTSASSCERNWSAHDFVHSRRRNRLRVETADKLVYVFSNLRLSRKIKDIDYEERTAKWTDNGLQDCSDGNEDEDKDEEEAELSDAEELGVDFVF
jgi:Protein of unknown function (DUF 659)/hAT family C-terminal dimerisation region